MSILLKRGVSLEQSKEPALSRPCHVYTENVVISRMIQPAQSMDELSPQQILELCRTAQVKDELDGALLADKLEQAAKDGCLELVADALDDEPYVSSRVNHLIHQTELVASGLMLAGKAAGVEKLSAAVFWNIMNLETRLPKELTLPDGSKGVIHRTGGRYPQGLPRRYRAARQKKCYLGTGALIHLHRAVFEGRVQNTVFLTVGGNCVRNSLNMEIPLGMPVSRVLDYAGLLDEPNTVVAGGGSMTGAVLDNPEKSYVQPDTRAVLAFRQRPVSGNLQCIGCGRCIDACPQSLPVYYIYRAAQQKLYSEFESFEYERCIECGCCSHVCPAKLNVMEEMRRMKQTFRRREEEDLVLRRKIDIGMGPLEDDEPQETSEPSLAAVQLKKLAQSIEQSLSGHGEHSSAAGQAASEQADFAPEQAQNRRKKKKNRKKSGQNQPENAAFSGTSAQPAVPGSASSAQPEQQPASSSGTSRLPESVDFVEKSSAVSAPEETGQAALPEAQPESVAAPNSEQLTKNAAPVSENEPLSEAGARVEDSTEARPQKSRKNRKKGASGEKTGALEKGKTGESTEKTKELAEEGEKTSSTQDETPGKADISPENQSESCAAEPEIEKTGEPVGEPEKTAPLASDEMETEFTPNNAASSVEPENPALPNQPGEEIESSEKAEPSAEESSKSTPEAEIAVSSQKAGSAAEGEEQAVSSAQSEEELPARENPENVSETELPVLSQEAGTGETEKIVDSLKALEQETGKSAVHVTVKPHSGSGGNKKRSGRNKGGKKQ